MKITKSHIMFFFIVLAALFLIAASPFQGETPPASDGPAPLTVPVAVGFALTAGIGFLIVNGMKSFSIVLQKNKYFKWFPDLSGLSATTTTAIVTTIILFANKILSAVPSEAAPVIVGFSMVLGAIMATYGVHFTVKGFQPATNSQSNK